MFLVTVHRDYSCSEMHPNNCSPHLSSHLMKTTFPSLATSQDTEPASLPACLPSFSLSSFPSFLFVLLLLLPLFFSFFSLLFIFDKYNRFLQEHLDYLGKIPNMPVLVHPIPLPVIKQMRENDLKRRITLSSFFLTQKFLLYRSPFCNRAVIPAAWLPCMGSPQREAAAEGPVKAGGEIGDLTGVQVRTGVWLLGEG